MMNASVTALVLFFTFAQGKKLPWHTQHGTFSHPKQMSYWSGIRKGDVFIEEGEYFRARRSGNRIDSPEEFNFPLYGHNDVWQRVERGTFMLPYKLSDLPNEESLEIDAIYKNGDDGRYFRAVCDDWQNEQCLQEVDEYADWMSLLRPIIGDQPLGDVIIPGTHDSGTYGMDENYTLVDQHSLYQIGEVVAPETMLNWSLTQDGNFEAQLNAGFRTMDLRITDLEDTNGTFHWWHGITADPIFEGLDHIAEFATSHPEEILILEFWYFDKPGNDTSPTYPIRDERKDEIAEILLDKLGHRMAYQSYFSNNPTMNELLAHDTNVMVKMLDDHIEPQDDRFWDDFVHYEFSARANPEGLFDHRSETLRNYKNDYADWITQLSGCNTPDEKTIVGGLLRSYGDEDWVWDIIDIIVPGLSDVDPDLMSFEGLYVDIINMARDGTNNNGMRSRRPDYYINGASVDFDGINWQIHHWLARPSLYKLNIVFVDDFASCDAVETAILGNQGEIPREVTVAYQGSTRDGFYEWDGNFQAVGGDEGHNCTTVLARYQVTSETFEIPEVFADLDDKSRVTFLEGQYPEDAIFTLEVTTDPDSEWHLLSSYNIAMMIDTNMDLFLRSSTLGESGGFAYVSLDYDHYTDECETIPTDGYLDLVTWG